MNVETLIHYAGKLDGLAHKHVIVSEASGNRGLLSELERVQAVRIQGRLGGRPLTPVRGMRPVLARNACLEGKKNARRPQQLKRPWKKRYHPRGSFTGDNIT